jgi:hypothetical protein
MLRRGAVGLAIVAAAGAVAFAARAGGHAVIASGGHRTAKTCPVTLPNREPPPAAAVGALPRVPPEWDGNGKLWVKLWPHGVMVATKATTAPDGSFGFKIPWWRATTGTLTVTSTRLDARSRAVPGDVPDGYGSTGFQVSGVSFSTQGCWRVTGRVGPTTLSFVTLVVTAAGNGY